MNTDLMLARAWNKRLRMIANGKPLDAATVWNAAVRQAGIENIYWSTTSDGEDECRLDTGAVYCGPVLIVENVP